MILNKMFYKRLKPCEAILKFIKRDWAIIVGDSIALKCFPTGIINQSLLVKSVPGTVQSELFFLKPAIILKISERYNARIREIVIS